MHSQSRSTFKFLMTASLVFAVLTSFGTSALAQAGTRAASLDTGLSPGSLSQESPDAGLEEKLKQFEGYLANMQRELAIPGMSAAIVKDQELIWAQGFGYADVAAERPAAPDTPYEIASLTKTFGSTILLQLVEQGKVNLDDPVSKYGVFIKSPGIIHVKHLLSMTSQREPGSVFIYNGNRYGLLQKVIERASGRPFSALVIETILNPLGMSDSIPITMVDQPAYAHIQDRLSIPYGMDGTYFPRFTVSAGLVSTAPDLAKFLLELTSPQHLDPVLMAEMTSPQVQSGEDGSWGLGIGIQHGSQGDVLWHHGNNGDFRALMVINQEQRNGAVILTNGEYGATLANEIADRTLTKLSRQE